MKNKKIIIIGAGSFASVVADTVLRCGYSLVGFADDNKPLGSKILGHYVIVSTITDLVYDCQTDFDYYVVAIGNNAIRKQVFDSLSKTFQTTNIIDPQAMVSSHASLQNGNIVLAGAVINAHATIGQNCIINSQALIDHDTKVANHCHIAQGTIIGSNVNVNKGVTTTIGQAIPSFSCIE